MKVHCRVDYLPKGSTSLASLPEMKSHTKECTIRKGKISFPLPHKVVILSVTLWMPKLATQRCATEFSGLNGGCPPKVPGSIRMPLYTPKPTILEIVFK
jgi:hypothetical protein